MAWNSWGNNLIPKLHLKSLRMVEIGPSYTVFYTRFQRLLLVSVMRSVIREVLDQLLAFREGDMRI